MTSAPNPRRRLSGNKFLLAALSVVLLSCNAFRMVPEGNAEVPDKPPIDIVESKDTQTKVETEPIKIPKPDQKHELVEFFGETYLVAGHKKEFKIALILPFYHNNSGDLVKRTSSIMLDYYTGVLMALNSLQAKGINLKLYVYDNQNDSNELKSILKKRELTSMDFIVGPIVETNMAIVSEFALKHDIGVISPFSSIGKLETENPRFYATAPNPRMKARQLIDFLSSEHAGKKLIILRDGQPYEKQFVPILLEELKLRNTVKYVEQEYNSGLNWNSLMSSSDTTIIYLPTQQSIIVSSTLGYIYSTKRDAMIIGEHSWADFEDNDYSFWTKLNVHLLATDFIDYQSNEVNEFRRLYRQENITDPSLYAYLGYDQFHFLGDFLMAFGEHYATYLNDKDFRYLSSSFKFTRTDGFNQNTKLFILRFKDMKLELAE